MTFSRFFIDRPIFAGVISLVTVIAGVLAFARLPLAEYPEVQPPTVLVRASYPGANPTVISDTVAAPLEQQINGVEGMLYMASHTTSDGTLLLRVTFEQGVDARMAQVEVQNRVSRALPRLPQEVQRIGVTTQKTAPDMLMVVHLVSPGGRYDLLHLSNFAQLQVKDTLARLEGVGDVVVWGSGEYSLRVWLDPDLMAARQLVTSDVVRALREQNAQVAAGAVGQSPGGSAGFQLSVNTRGRLASVDEFRDVIVKVGARGELVRLADVARVELGSNAYALRSLLNNEPAVGIQIVQSPDASALAVAGAVREAMRQMSAGFPEGIEYRIAYDPTIFVRASIRNVAQTLLEAVGLVVLVVIVFLRSWRASLITLAAVPVSLVGTFAVMYLLGYSLNTLSLFGLVLSIGIVVDDAIVVVENVERHLALGRDSRTAAINAMSEVTGPIVAITSVLAAVFIPTAFLSGLTGQFYSQFAVTIAISTVLSAINSLTLSPALAAVLLKPHPAARAGRPGAWSRIAAGLEGVSGRLAGRYASGVLRVIRAGGVALVVYAGLLGLTWLGFSRVPGGFVPAQDKYYLVGIVQLPFGASLDRTEAMVRKVTDVALSEPGVESVVAFPGLSVNGFTSNPSAAVLFAMLDPFDQRTTPDLGAMAIAASLNGRLSAIDDGFAAIFPPPPVPGLGAIGGFKLQIEDRTGQGYEALYEATQQVLARARQDPRLAGVFTGYEINVPQVEVDVDREQALRRGIPIQGIYETLQVYLGSLYVNDFNMLGRTYQVNVQADARHRMQPDTIGRLQTRNATGQMVPLSAVASIRPEAGPDPVTRYNGHVAADINGGPAPGISSGEAAAAIAAIVEETLPPGFAFEWTELTYQQMRDGQAGLWVFPLAVLLAYLILAAQYNSWTLPLAVLLVVPLVLLSALTGVWLTGGDNNIFTQIGFLVLVGLATKNAILIVEFAVGREREGEAPLAAVLDAARLRLRPILMTSLAFVMGVVPLVWASGAGAEMRHAMGVAVFSGMLGVTVFGLFFTPLFYVVIRRMGQGRQRSGAALAPLLGPEAPDHA